MYWVERQFTLTADQSELTGASGLVGVAVIWAGVD